MFLQFFISNNYFNISKGNNDIKMHNFCQFSSSHIKLNYEILNSIYLRIKIRILIIIKSLKINFLIYNSLRYDECIKSKHFIPNK